MRNIYAQEDRETMLEEDSINPIEEAFMKGYCECY